MRNCEIRVCFICCGTTHYLLLFKDSIFNGSLGFCPLSYIFGGGYILCTYLRANLNVCSGDLGNTVPFVINFVVRVTIDMVAELHSKVVVKRFTL